MNYLIFILFFVSGACGLVYEVVWSREFTLVLGGTTHAMTAVVVSFMGGLALGSFGGGRFIDRSRRDPVMVYAVLEAGIGVLALLVPFLVAGSRPALAYAYQHLQDLPWAYNMVRFFTAALIVFPATVMMGATLPVLVKGTFAGREHFGSTAGRLYAVNTAGAVAGAALAGFALLPALGGHRTVALAAGMNLAIAATVLLWRRAFGRGGERTADDTSPPAPVGRPLIAVLLIGYGFSGFAALIYQIAWTRSLALTLGGSTYTFSLVLTAYIGGLAAGGAAMTVWVDRLKRPLLAAGMMEFAISVSALAVLPLLDNINLAMYRWYYEYQWTGPWLPFIRFGVAFGMVAVPTIVMGALLPVIARVVGAGREGAGEAMGWVYSANTVGAIAGAFAAGYVLLDLFGARVTVFIATGSSLLVGAVWVAGSELRRRTAALAVGAGLLAGAALMRYVPAPDPLVVNSGPYIYAQRLMPAVGPEGLREHLHRLYEVLYIREDSETSVMVVEERIEQWRSLRINGKVDASSAADLPNQVLLAQLPLLLHPHPRTVMVLGLASGVTAGSALLHPIDSLDCLELSPAVIDASQYFDEYNRLQRGDPRFHLIIGDGRNHLSLSASKYDVIISEPSNPWQAAMSSMFTAEFFILMRESLNGGGIGVVWIDVYDMDLPTLRFIIRTFISVFPHAGLWESEAGGDYILLGSDSPMAVDYGRFSERVSAPAIRDELARIQDRGADDLLARLMMDETMMAKLAGPGPVHTDDRRQLEFEMPRLAFSPYTERVPEIYAAFADAGGPALPVSRWPEGARDRIERRLKKLGELRRQFLELERRHNLNEVSTDEYLVGGEVLLDQLKDYYPSRTVAKFLAQEMVRVSPAVGASGGREASLHLLMRANELDPASGRAASAIAQYYLAAGDFDQAQQWAKKALERKPRNYLAMAVMAKCARVRGDFAVEEFWLRKALDVYPGELDYRLLLGRSLLSQGKFRDARAELGQFLARRPDNSDGHFFLGLVLYYDKDPAGAARQFRRALELDPRHPSRGQMEDLLHDLETPSP